MHLLVSPLCAPPEYVQRFAFIRERYDDPDHARQYVAAMTSLLDDIVGDVVAALRTAGLWENTLFVWSSDNGGAIELDTGMKNNYPLVNAAEPFPLYEYYILSRVALHPLTCLASPFLQTRSLQLS